MSHSTIHIVCENIDSPEWSNNPDFSDRKTMDVWKLSINDLLPEIDRLHKILSEEEKSRVERYYQRKDKIRFTIGRGMLRSILARYLNGSPSNLSFKKGLYNKPFLEQPGIHFNISYSENLIIIGVANEPIGVDIEYINFTLNYRGLAEDVFSQEERNLIVSSTKGREDFFKIWTRKEALLKAVSRGLGDDLKNFSCLDGIQAVIGMTILDKTWNIQSFLLDTHYYVSMAYQKTTTFRYFNSHNIFLSGEGLG